MEVFGKSNHNNGLHALPDNDIMDLSKKVEDWQVESDSEDDNAGM
jgi:hypothetical protein